MNEAIVDRIDKLLRISQHGSGATVAEAESALLMAQRLAAKHNIDLNNLATKVKGTQYVIADLAYNFVQRSFRQKLLEVLTRNFRCRAVFRVTPEGTLDGAFILGEQSNVDIVLKLHGYALEVCEKECMAYCMEVLPHLTTFEMRETTRNQWCEGFVKGIEMRFKQQVQSNTEVGLMVLPDPEVDKVTDELADGTFPIKRAQPTNGTDNLAYLFGFITGKEMADPNDGLIESQIT